MTGSCPEDRRRIQKKYAQIARWYDRGELLIELLGVRALRRQLLKGASGKILEIAVGTGINLPYYPPCSDLTAIDLSGAMLKLARGKAERRGLTVRFLAMDAERLAFPDQSFDTIVDTLGLCTFPDPVGALLEMGRLCRPGGRILLLEHGRSDREWLGQWQDRGASWHFKHMCCQWNRKPLQLVRQAGLCTHVIRRSLLGIFIQCEVVSAGVAKLPDEKGVGRDL